jgi:uncharacterized membrane protein
VDLTPLVEAAQNSALSEWMRTSLKAVAVINALHVLSLVTVFGTILVVDLRLLGYPSVVRSFKRMHDELLKWTWGAFGIAAITGVLLFMVNAVTYHRNTAFWLKMATMVIAGINMLVFELVTAKTAPSWDKGVAPPNAARLAGALSIVLWVAVIVFGRWIGFTKGYDFSIPEDVQFDFSLPQ